MLKELRRQWEQSRLLRLGVVGIAGVLALNGVLDLRQSREAQSTRQRQLVNQIAKLNQFREEKDWGSRAEKADFILVDLESRVWRSPTEGLAQATFNDWLSGLSQKLALTKSQIEVTVDAGRREQDSGITLVRAKVAFEFNAVSFRAWLEEIEKNNRSVIVERLSVKQEPTGRVEGYLIAPFRVESADAPSGGGS